MTASAHFHPIGSAIRGRCQTQTDAALWTADRRLRLVPGGYMGYRDSMSRPLAATFAGLLFVAVYITAAITLPDVIGRMHWTVEAVYWCIAGVVWVFPVRWLMLWSVGKR